MRRSNLFRTLAVLVLFVLAGGVASVASGQTTRRRKPTVKPTPQPTAVNQAELYKDQSRQIIEGNTEVLPQPTETPVVESTDEKIDKIGKNLAELSLRIKSMETRQKDDAEEKQKRLLMNLDILTRAEERAESLRKQLFEMIERENAVKTKLEQLDYELRPEMIDRQIAFAGSLRPEELREARRKNLEVERTNLGDLMVKIQQTRSNLEASLGKADQLVEKLRLILEKEIDDALSDSP